ncbi:MAG: family 4 glycosyl hydrolase [Promethearchaeota archaeon]
MPDRFKIAYIGAGSFRFSTGLFLEICQRREPPNDLSPMEIGLCDINEDSLRIMKKMFRKIVDKAKRLNDVDILITTSTNREEVLENADVVFKSISVGIQEAEWYDIHLPYKLGIPQNTGDTVGPGGLFRGLRTNPVVADIARDMKRLCPKAMMLNYTNPQATIVMAAHTVAPEVQYIGLCHELFGGMKNIHEFFNKKMGYNIPSWQDFDIEYAGVNHFGFITKLEYQEDLYPKLRENAHSLYLDNYKNRGYNYHLLEKYGWFPYPGSRHIAEFLPDYYNLFNHKIQSKHWKFPVLRNVRLLGTGRRAAYFAFKVVGSGVFVPKPRSSGENAVGMTTAWLNDESTPFVVNIPNNGIVPQLPEDCIVEVPAVYKDKKITPVSTINLDSKVADLLRPHAEQHRLTVDAALGNDIDLVIKAMQHDPMNQWIEDPDRIEYLTKMLLYYEREWLPDEWKEWIPKRDDLKKSRWWIAPAELQKFGRRYKQKKFFLTENLREKAYFDK